MQEMSLQDLYAGNFYHICTEGLEQVTLFREEEDYRVGWNYLAFSAWRTEVTVVAFVLMSNHIHELVACSSMMQARKCIRLFKRLLSSYLSQKYRLSKVMHGSDDSIIQIDTIQYLRNCIAYIFRNPVSARICSRPESYSWSSYSSCFRGTAEGKSEIETPVSELGFTAKRRLLKTGMDLSDCPLAIDAKGYMTMKSFVRNGIAEKAFRYSGKSFMYHMGICNDARMEYELVYQPLIGLTDVDLRNQIEAFVSSRFNGKSIAELSVSEKCSILRPVFFSNRTSIPQLSRIMGLPRELIKKLLSQ